MSAWDEVFTERARAHLDAPGQSPETATWCSMFRLIDLLHEATAVGEFFERLDATPQGQGTDVEPLRSSLIRIAARTTAWVDTLDSLAGKV